MPYVLELSDDERETLSAHLSICNIDMLREIAADLQAMEPYRGICISAPPAAHIQVSSDCGVAIPVTIIRHELGTLEHTRATERPELLARVTECLLVQTAAAPLIAALSESMEALRSASQGISASRSDTIAALLSLRERIDLTLRDLDDKEPTPEAE